MIIQCEQCSTKFRLDDSKVTAKGVKVRCAKCKHVFSVKQEQPADEGISDFGALLDQKSNFTLEEQSTPEEQQDHSFTSPQTSFEANTFNEQTFQDNPFSTDAPETPHDTEQFQADDVSSFYPPDDEQNFSMTQEEPQTPAGDVEFSGFDFGGLSSSTEEVPTEPVIADEYGMPPLASVPESSSPAADDEYSSLDFGSDNLFGDAVTPPAEEPDMPINFEFQMDEFADSLGGQDTAHEKGKAGEPKQEEPFSLGEIDFGDELTAVAVQEVNPDALKPGEDFLFAPLGGATGKQVPAMEETVKFPPPGVSTPSEEQEELPPLSITSRRKQSSAVTLLLSILGIIVLAVLGFYGYTAFLAPQSGPAQEAGRIALRSVQATYLKNSTAGNILVISGEAVNDYKKPRAAIQIKGLVYGPDGQVITSKVAYGGNPLTPEQLATMPMEKIEAAMANQFGDSLANLEVAPGKAISFMIVIPEPPAEASDYGVEPAGSTVATGKQ